MRQFKDVQILTLIQENLLALLLEMQGFIMISFMKVYDHVFLF